MRTSLENLARTRGIVTTAQVLMDSVGITILNNDTYNDIVRAIDGMAIKKGSI